MAINWVLHCKTGWSLLPTLLTQGNSPLCTPRKIEQPNPPWAPIATPQPSRGAGLILPMVLVPRAGGKHAIPCMESQKRRHGAGPGGKNSTDKVWSKDKIAERQILLVWEQQRERTLDPGLTRKGTRVREPALLHAGGGKRRFIFVSRTNCTRPCSPWKTASDQTGA